MTVSFRYADDPGDPSERHADSRFAAAQFTQLIEDEFYSSDISFKKDDQPLDLAFEKKDVFITITGYEGRTELASLRSWSHIRRRSADCFSIWYPSEGSMVLTQHGRTIRVQPGEFAISYANEPFRIASRRAEAEVCRSYHVFVPSYLLYRSFPDIKRFCARIFRAESGQALVVRDLFISMFREADRLSCDFQRSWATMATEVSAEVIRMAVVDELQKPSSPQARLRDLLQYIELNLHDSEMSVASVAHGCGISVRYVHHLLKEDGKAFQDYVRNLRLERAMQLLQNALFKDLGITEVAYRIGFKNGNHFSQAFKMRFSISPSQVRLEHCA